jgi:hypothetical protein
MTGEPIGPFGTEREALLTPAVRAVFAAFDRDPGAGKMAPHNHRLLCEALATAGVELGAYDHRIALWLATWEPQTVAVIAGWASRANLAGAVTITSAQAAVIAQALDDAQAYRRRRAEAWCSDCETAPEGACQDHLADLDQADAYAELGRQLAAADITPEEL